MLYNILSLLIIANCIPCVLLIGKATEDRSDWIDPNDMLNFDPSTNTKIKRNKDTTGSETPGKKDGVDVDIPAKNCPVCGDGCAPCPPCKCEACVPCTCEQAALPLLRQYIKVLLSHMDGQMPSGKTEDYLMHLRLSGDQAGMLQTFVAEGNLKHVHDVHDILTGMIDRVAASRMNGMEKLALWLEDKLGLSLNRMIQFFMLAALASVVLFIEIRLQIAWRRRVSQLIVLMFVISVPWTWYDLYKQAEIKQQSVASKTVPAECQTGEYGTWMAFKSYFTLQEDKCHDYYERLMIDPLVRVPPTKAIAVTFVRFFLAPLKDVGSAMSEFIRALLIDLPLTLYPVAIGLVSLFFFMFLFMWFGYSIRLPFFLTIERSPTYAAVGADGQLQQTIAAANQQTLAQLEKLQAQLESTECQMSEKLQHLERVQQTAIEYNMSAPVSPAESPSIPRTLISAENCPSIPMMQTFCSNVTSSISNTEMKSELSDAEGCDSDQEFINIDSVAGATPVVKPDKSQETGKGDSDELGHETCGLSVKGDNVDTCVKLAKVVKGSSKSKCDPCDKMIDTLLPDGVIVSRDGV